jgi:hypothetical protein
MGSVRRNLKTSIRVHDGKERYDLDEYHWFETVEINKKAMKYAVVRKDS